MISDFLKTRAKLTPDKIALKEYIGDKSRSFSQLEKKANKLAGSMKSIGVFKGDRIGVLCRNRIEFFETLFAVSYTHLDVYKRQVERPGRCGQGGRDPALAGVHPCLLYTSRCV